MVGVGVFLVVFAIVVFFVPEIGGYFLEANNFIPADPLKTPAAHRAGVVLHAVLRDPARGAAAVQLAVPGRAGDGHRDDDPLLPAVARPRAGEVDPLPRHALQVRGSRVFVVVFLVLGYLGIEPTTVWGQFGFDAFFLDTKDIATWVARVCTVALLPLLLPHALVHGATTRCSRCPSG